MTNLNMIFHVVVSVYRLVKIWTSPQFPAEFRNGLLCALLCLAWKKPSSMADSTQHMLSEEKMLSQFLV